jgi:hypothetical protein
VNEGTSGGFNRLAIGGQPYAGPNAAYTGNQAIINIDSSSQLNANSLWIGGTATGGGLKTYEFPLFGTPTNGKMSMTGGMTIAGNANGNASKIEVKLSPTTGAATSIAGLTGGLSIAGSSLAGTDGRFTLDGTSVSFNARMTVATGNGSSGTVSVKDAILTVYATNPSFNDWQYIGLNNNSVATVILDNGTLQSGGDSSNDAIVIRGSGTSGNNSSGYVRGTGTLKATHATGFITNNGQVVADGGLLSVVTPNLDSSVEGSFLVTMGDGKQAGWYATTGSGTSKLTLPNITFASNDRTWGETVTDASPDLVNSVLFDVSGTVTGSLAGSLLATDHTTLPTGLVNAVGAWEFSGLTFGGGSVQLTVRYDDALATLLAVNESDLKLWHYDGAMWQDVTGSVDTGNNRLMSIAGINSLSPFAIAENAINASAVPEPSTYALGLLSLVGFGLSVWRKRRSK